MTMKTVHNSATKWTPVTPRVSLVARLSYLHAVWRQRQALKSLDAAALNDIGVTRIEAESEANRSIWDAPESWRR